MNPPTDAAAGLHLDAQGRIDEDLLCMKCGYNLRTLEPTGICVECGQPVQASIRGRSLAMADLAWLVRLRQGIVMLLICALCAVICTIIIAGELYNAVPLVVSVAVGVVGLMLGVVGIWRFTSPEQPHATLREHLKPGTLAMYAFLFGALVGLTTLAWSHHLPRLVTDAMTWAALAISSPGIVFLLLHVRTLARRLPDANLANAALLLAWAVTFTVTGVLALAFGFVQRTLGYFARTPDELLVIWQTSHTWQIRLTCVLVMLGGCIACVLVWLGGRLRGIVRSRTRHLRGLP